MTRVRTFVRTAVLLTSLLSFTLAACSAGAQPRAQGPTAPSADTHHPSGSSIPPSTSAYPGTPIRITIGKQTLNATVWDNPTGRALLEQLPLRLSFKDLNGEEKIGHLEVELIMDGMPKGDDPRAGDLGYYAPWGNVVLYYGDVGYWDGIARIGSSTAICP